MKDSDELPRAVEAKAVIAGDWLVAAGGRLQEGPHVPPLPVAISTSSQAVKVFRGQPSFPLLVGHSLTALTFKNTALILGGSADRTSMLARCYFSHSDHP